MDTGQRINVTGWKRSQRRSAYGGGPGFDPMLEENGGWIAREAWRHDTEMMEAVIEIMAEASKQIRDLEFNPFKEKFGEILPPNMETNFNGSLVRKDAVSFKVNSENLLARIVVLRDQMLIAKFVGPKPPPSYEDVVENPKPRT